MSGASFVLSVNYPFCFPFVKWLFIAIQMRASQLFLTVDPSLGRLDYSLLSDQTLMEILIDGFDEKTKKRYQDERGMYLGVCEWPSIKCDCDDRVIEINIDSSNAS